MNSSDSTDAWDRLRSLAPGQRVKIARRERIIGEGTLVPSHDFSGPRIVQLKLESGYNVGIAIEPDDQVEVVGTTVGPTSRHPHHTRPATEPPSEPWVGILTTGGTIASKVDYRTGGVRPVRDENEILEFYPDLARDGPVRIEPVFDRLSENFAPADWVTLGARVVETFRSGAVGVVIAHGTDTLGFTAAALSFLVKDLSGPVVVVGAQRSPDRPSSDGPSNLEAAARVARLGELGEVVVVMHAGLSDGRFAIHRGTRVRKMHSSRRDAFQSRNGPPLGYLDETGIHWNETPRGRAAGPPRVEGTFAGEAELLWSHPGLDPERAATFAKGLRGLVIAGTGLGHIATTHLSWITAAVERGVVVVMTTQCLEGSVDPYVYATGRELVRSGVTFVDDLLPETAYVKLLWALGTSRDPVEVRHWMTTDLVGEFEPRHPPSGSP
ncbi:MAG: Glu-tRNA(Gln) amidotransferase subunit GatD [Thermoplasmata archaeon]